MAGALFVTPFSMMFFRQMSLVADSMKHRMCVVLPVYLTCPPQHFYAYLITTFLPTNTLPCELFN